MSRLSDASSPIEQRSRPPRITSARYIVDAEHALVAQSRAGSERKGHAPDVAGSQHASLTVGVTALR